MKPSRLGSVRPRAQATHMATPQAPAAAPRPRRFRLLPFHDPSRGSRMRKVVAWLGGIAVVVALLSLLGIDVSGWFEQFRDAVGDIGFGYLVAGWSLQTVQTTMTALGWFYILRAAYPAAPPLYRQVLAAY